ncbi:MAG TPA: spore coat U domain-containing protein [Candidatus Baltobacteraceae bacterium]
MLALACALLGATTTHALAPSATVIAKCTIAGALPLAFGSYDPVVANLTTNLDVAPNALSISCTRGAPSVTVALDLGLHATGSTRRLLSGADFLTYEIYTTAARTTVWNATNTVSYASATMAATGLPVYGRVPFGQDATVGASYTDTITATVNF